MEWLIILVIALIVLSILSNLKTSAGGYEYRMKRALFSPAERSFLGVLDQAVADRYRVLGKVRVADILTPEKGLNRKNWQIAFNKISAKHFDFVLCDKLTLEVIAVIELDDRSHQRKRTQARDALLASACSSAQLPLIRFAAQAGYQIDAIRNEVDLALNPAVVGDLALGNANN